MKMFGKKKSRKKKSKKKMRRRSGHGDVHYRVLGKRQLKEIREKGRTYVTIEGERKKVTPGNLATRKGKTVIGYYRRSDTKRIALRQYASDRSRSEHEVKRYSPRRGMEGDRRGRRV